MITLPPLDIFKLADADKPRIGFRVVASGGEEWLRNTLEPRHPHADATSQTLLNHLGWEKGPSPFVSLWRSWPRAVRWARSRQRLGSEDIDIAAVWIYDQVVYDGHKAAMTLPLPPDKRLSYYEDEVVMHGLGGKDDYKVLAWFEWVTERQWETVTFVLDNKPLLTSLPVGLLKFKVSSDDDETIRTEAERWQEDGIAALKDEVYFRTRYHDNSKVHLLATLLCGESFATAPVMPLRPTSRDIASDELIAKLAELGMD